MSATFRVTKRCSILRHHSEDNIQRKETAESRCKASAALIFTAASDTASFAGNQRIAENTGADICILIDGEGIETNM